jgi:hypothetical protein
MDAIFADEMPRSRVAVLLKHFSQLADSRFGPDAPATCFALSVASNTMWSVGAKNIFSFDGALWTRVV